MGTFDYIMEIEKGTSMVFYEIFLARNSRTSRPFELFLCSSEFNTLLLVPNKPITDLRISFFIFCSIFGHGRGPYGLTQTFPAWDFFLGIAGFIIK